jgi:hypothetical protein
MLKTRIPHASRCRLDEGSFLAADDIQNEVRNHALYIFQGQLVPQKNIHFLVSLECAPVTRPIIMTVAL